MLLGTSLGFAIRCAPPSGAAGPDVTAPVISSKTVPTGGDTLAMVYSEPLDEASVPATSQFALGGTAATVSGVEVEGDTVTLTLAGFVMPGETVTLTYAVPVSGRIQDLAGNAAAALTTSAVTNNSTYADVTAPVRTSIIAVPAGDQIIVAYDEALDEASVPANGQYALAGTTATVADVTVLDNTVVIDLTGFVQAGETVTLSYTQPVSGRVQDVAGNDAPAFTTQSVTNLSTYELVPPEFVGYAISNSAAGATRTPDLSAISLVAGDILIAACQNRSTSTVASMTPPASQGWAHIPELYREVSGATETYYWKRWGAGDTDDSTPTFTWSSAGNGNAVAISVWRSCRATGNPYTITPVKVDHAAAATLTAGNVGSAVPAYTTTLWGFHATDDNTLNGHTRGTLIVSQNISTVAAIALYYEQGVNSQTEEVSVTESTNGNDTARIMTLVLEGGAAVADPTFALTLLSTTGYAGQRTNATPWQQCSVVTDTTARSGYIWRYGAWYDRAPAPASRLWLFKQRRPVGDLEGWETPTLRASDSGLNDTGAAGDGHNSPCLMVDEDGCLHVAWQGHGTEYAWCYWKGSGPDDITVDSNGPTFVADISYPKFMQMPDGTLLFAGRLGAAGGNAQQCLWEQIDGVWTQITAALMDYPAGGDDESPYMQHMHVNPTTGRLHISWCWARDNYTAEYHRVMYMYGVRNAPGDWDFFDIEDDPVTLPANNDSRFVAYDVPINSGLPVHHGMSCTTADSPLISYVSAKDGYTHGGGSNRYLLVRDGGSWVRQLVHEVHPTWDLVDANGAHDDPDGVNSEYQQVSQSPVLYDPATEAVHLVYRSNYELASAGIPGLMVTSSFAAPYDTWTEPSILVDTPCGDMQPTHDTPAWNVLGVPTFLVSLIDSADQYVGGGNSSVYIADCILPEEP